VRALADAGPGGKGGRAYALLFSDGVSNLGPADAAPQADVPVYALSGEPTANHAALRHFARESGGAYVNLAAAPADEAALPEADARVLDRIGDEPFALVGVDYDAAQVADVLPRPGEPITGARLLVGGRLLAPEATVKLNYGHGKRVTHTQTFTLRQADAVETGLVPRFWAQQRVADLSVFAGRNAEELLRLGREFVIVTPSTSLIVLETAEQYVEHRIVPPRSRPEVYAQFIEQIERRRAEVASTHEQKVQRALAMWTERVTWWETKFEYPADLVAMADANAGGETTGVAGPRGRVFGGGRARRPAAGASLPRARAANAPAPQGQDAPAAADRESGDALNRAEPEQEAAAAGEPPAPGEMPAEPSTPAPAAAEPHDQTVEAERDPRGTADERLALRGDAPDEGRGGAPGMRGDDAAPRDQFDVILLPTDDAGGQDDDDDNGYVTGRGRPGRDGGGGPTVAIQAWDPNTPYLQAMKAAGPAEAYDVYLDQRKTFGTAPAFYLDCADHLLRNDRRAEGLRVLGSVAELHLEDARLLRVVAHRFAQVGELDQAIAMFERILKLRPEEPQSHRDLALALADRADRRAGEKAEPSAGASAAAMTDYLAALTSLNNVIMGDWQRFEGIQVIALMEANRIIERARALPGVHDFNHGMDARLVKLLDVDVRVVLTWDADATDIDLWVTEPSGEVCLYSHNRTTIGGLMSKDFTQGYGPEEYCLRRLMPGQYKIQANFFGSRLQQVAGPTTVQATVITDFGRPTEKRQALTLRLTSKKEVVDIGTVTLGAAPQGK
jgi:Ca-activated chloride channel family protein